MKPNLLSEEERPSQTSFAFRNAVTLNALFRLFRRRGLLSEELIAVFKSNFANISAPILFKNIPSWNFHHGTSIIELHDRSSMDASDSYPPVLMNFE